MDIVVMVVSALSFLGTVVVVDRIGSGQLPMALTVLESAAGAAETTPGAATANVSAPATATEAIIFLNMMMYPNASRIRYGNCTVPVDIHCKMFSTETVKVLVKRHL